MGSTDLAWFRQYQGECVEFGEKCCCVGRHSSGEAENACREHDSKDPTEICIGSRKILMGDIANVFGHALRI